MITINSIIIYFLLALLFRFVLPIFGSLNFISREFYHNIILVNDYFSRKQYLFWILLFPFSLWLISIIFYFFSLDLLVKNTWLTALMFWIILYVDIVFVLKRSLLLSKNNFVTLALVSVLITFLFNQLFYNSGFESLLPQESLWFWTILFAFVISSFWYRHRTITDNSNERIKNYIHKKSDEFTQEYNDILKDLNETQKDIILSILIVEDYNRPKNLRVCERIFSYIGLAKTTGIAQISQKGLSDVDSVQLLRKKIQEDLKDVDFNLSKIRSFLKKYNGSNYDDMILTVLQNMDEKFIER